MKKLQYKLNESLTAIHSLKTADSNEELLADTQKDIFSLRARDRSGNTVILEPAQAAVSVVNCCILYEFSECTVKLRIAEDTALRWCISIENHSELAVEYIDIPNVRFSGRLKNNGGSCAVVSSYNEGLLVEDYRMKTEMLDPEFPSLGCYMMYPYMLSSPIMMWLYGDEGILMTVSGKGDHPTGLDFICDKESTEFRTRIFVGGEYGGGIDEGIEVAWQHFCGDWHSGAEIYRSQIYEKQFAAAVADIALPEWYTEDMPLVLTYPVRGIHDMDEMSPNKLFPYENVLPIVDEIAERTKTKIMVLLMHWEGTAPWAPPYVYPPYGGEKMLRDFMDKLHTRGHLLGVYCSGFGFTEQSNLIESYNLHDLIIENNLADGFCKSPAQEVVHSRICTAQRSGYDICAASKVGRDILNDALAPLLTSGVDYVQALDQNHGGGMYFCYAADHGHPPTPGKWLIDASAELLSEWRAISPNTLLGCESAAAEPYINELRLSDNRYELCYMHGKAIPLYSFLYHKYLHNFMGNQVACPIEYTTEGLMYRLAYSFAAGDMLTLVLNDDGEIMFHWGMRDFSRTPNREAVLGFCAALSAVHRLYPALFRDGEMIKPVNYTSDKIKIGLSNGNTLEDNAVLSTAWLVDGKKIQLLVNYTDVPREISLETACSISNTAGEAVYTSNYVVAPYTAVCAEIK